jgi:energy-coupling factor transporter ATP-binding protein EcfA2
VYLEQVGLSGYETHRASELSSGQKQRLSIARALAKNTEIIVADEPTGNLDSETGEQIVKLLGELSKDRLVIMVTHNYEQAAPYVTRKIRIHEGQVISDVPVNGGRRNLDSETEPESEMTAEPVTKPRNRQTLAAPIDKSGQHRLARYFAARNAKTTIGRTVLFTIFLFIISTVSFLFVGELFMNKDDYATKSYSHATFYKEDDTRLVVKRSDGEALTNDDIEEISSVANVVTVDSCDYANDINYYIEEGTDYRVIYGNEDNTKIDFLNDENFMMSVDAISEEDLAAGRMPESQNEVVLYSADDSVLDSSKDCYFMAHNIWGSTAYYLTSVTIVGILKEETDQIYFSKQLCQMLSMNIDSGEYRLYYNYDKNYGDYRMKPQFIPVVSEDLTGNDVRLSVSAEDPPSGEVDFHWQEYDEEGNAYGNGLSAKVNVLPVKTDGHLSTSDFMEVSQEFFDTYYHHASTQASVYITSYAKTDSVLNKLKKKGYEGISTFRLSATDYEEEKVNERLTIIGISVFGLIALLVAEVLILRSLMKIRMKDYFVLKFIGMKLPIIKTISYYEIGSYTVAAMIITVCLMWILRFVGVSIIPELMWYYDVWAYVAFALYNLALTALTVASFNRLLKGRLNA